MGFLGCNPTYSNEKVESTAKGVLYCPTIVNDADGDGWDTEYGRSCKVPTICQFPEADQTIDGWGWEQGKSCRVVNNGSSVPHETAPDQAQQAGLKFDTTYYPFGIELYPKTTCGDGRAHNEMYFAVTEGSPLWAGACNNDSWAACADADCTSKWDQIPQDAKKIENGTKMVREPSCQVPCGQRHRVKSIDSGVETTAVIYDACPANHWNNRLAEVTTGKTPVLTVLITWIFVNRFIFI